MSVEFRCRQGRGHCSSPWSRPGKSRSSAETRRPTLRFFRSDERNSLVVLGHFHGRNLIFFLITNNISMHRSSISPVSATVPTSFDLCSLSLLFVTKVRSLGTSQGFGNFPNCRLLSLPARTTSKGAGTHWVVLQAVRLLSSSNLLCYIPL